MNIVFSVPKTSAPVIKEPIKTVRALVINFDQVLLCKEVYEISEKSKSVKNHKIYYRKAATTSHTINTHCYRDTIKIMVQDPMRAEDPNARPYRADLTVNGYVNSGKEFVITSVIHAEMNYEHSDSKPGLLN
jgi:hypothetical protein